MEKIVLENERIVIIHSQLERFDTLEFSEDMYADKESARTNWHKFVYAISRNMDSFGSVDKAIRKSAEPPKQFKEYISKRSEILQKYVDRDANGNAIVEGNNYVVVKRKDEFDVEIAKLNKKYKDAIDENDKIAEATQGLMTQMEEVTYLPIKKEYVPLTLTVAQLRAILPLIMED